MKKFLMVVGAVALGAVILGGVGFAILAYRGNALDVEAAEYSTQAVTAITAHWDKTEMMARAAPSLAASVTPERLDDLFAFFRRLGPLQGAPSCHGQAVMNADLRHGSRILGRYACKAHYEAGDATISLALVKQAGAWKIQGFHVDSLALLPRASTKA